MALLALALAAGPALARPAQLDRAAELLDAGEVEPALAILDREIRARPEDGRAHLLRSTARFMQGDTEGGRRDLDRALELDPGLRQGWLNQAALDIAEERLDAALAALLRARDLEPEAPDNGLNIGAVLVLQGKLAEASREFATYLRRNPGSAEAFYLVASNYALAGYAALAVQHLRQAVELDEKVRLEARTDPNFAELEANDAFRALLATDGFRPPAGTHVASRLFDEPYAAGQGKLLAAVIDSLQLAHEAFDRRVEVTPDWALVWGDLRIKVSAAGERGLVELTAPPDRFTPAEWRQRSEDLFRRIAVRLKTMG